MIYKSLKKSEIPLEIAKSLEKLDKETSLKLIGGGIIAFCKGVQKIVRLSTKILQASSLKLKINNHIYYLTYNYRLRKRDDPNSYHIFQSAQIYKMQKVCSLSNSSILFQQIDHLGLLQTLFLKTIYNCFCSKAKYNLYYELDYYFKNIFKKIPRKKS